MRGLLVGSWRHDVSDSAVKSGAMSSTGSFGPAYLGIFSIALKIRRRSGPRAGFSYLVALIEQVGDEILVWLLVKLCDSFDSLAIMADISCNLGRKSGEYILQD